MFWLDGSSTLPFTIISTSFVSKACVELITEALASVENQAEIAKSWVKIGDLDHWCLAASKLVDLADDLIDVNTSFRYYEGSISWNEKLCHCSQLSSQLMDSVTFSTFEHARERLFVTSKLTNSLPPTTLSPHRDYSVNRHSSSGSTETSAQVTTSSLALPHHANTTTHTTLHLIQPPQQPHPAPSEPSDDDTTASPAPPRHTPTAARAPTPPASGWHEGGNRSSDWFDVTAKVPGWEERKEERREERGGERKERGGGQENQGRRYPPSKPPTPPPAVTPQQEAMRVPDPPQSMDTAHDDDDGVSVVTLVLAWQGP
jgi:hypothetical protein